MQKLNKNIFTLKKALKINFCLVVFKTMENCFLTSLVDLEPII